MKIEGVSIQPNQPLSICNCRFGSSSNPLVLQSLFDQRLQSAFIGVTGGDWELKYLKDIACFYKLNPEDKSVYAEFPLTLKVIRALNLSNTLEDKDAQIQRLHDLLLRLEADRPTCECTCT
jgi:hypothetical protein